MPKLLVALPVCLFCVVSSVRSTPAYAWGERGHQIVSRVAARLVVERRGAKDTRLAPAFAAKELMLAHLANVPDIVWRGVGKEIEEQNAPTHFIDLEYVDPKPTYATLPKTVEAAEARMRELCAAPKGGYVCPEDFETKPGISLAGTAPWRVGQFYRLMRAELARAAGAKLDVATVDRAMTYGGLLSHFVGDLGQPLHATRDYNGWESGHGGLHSYFESEIVGSYPLMLEHEVYRAAVLTRPYERIMKVVPPSERAEAAKDPVLVAFALALDSHAALPKLRSIDAKHAVVKRSTTSKGLKLKAERKAPEGVREAFHGLVLERLATAADVLATLWIQAWTDAGSPDLSSYQSYAYPVAPEFVAPDYLAIAKDAGK